MNRADTSNSSPTTTWLGAVNSEISHVTESLVTGATDVVVLDSTETEVSVPGCDVVLETSTTEVVLDESTSDVVLETSATDDVLDSATTSPTQSGRFWTAARSAFALSRDASRCELVSTPTLALLTRIAREL
ncbi:MAG: hypothetical protein EB130_04120 [Actinobacteria bacterium]|nr:hypothetical protein [Actinomycetota bacterium]